MRKFIYIIILPIIALIMSSCAVSRTQKAMRTTSFMPDRVELRLGIDDFELIGETSVTVSYNRYLGMFTMLNEINGKEVAKRNVNTIQTYGRTWLSIGNFLERALYDAQLEIREAEIFIPVNILTEEEKMFLGARIKKTMKVKAYRVKDK